MTRPRDVLDRAAILSAAAPSDPPDAPGPDPRPVTILDVLALQVETTRLACETILQQCDAVTAMIATLQHRPRPESPDPRARPATFGRPAPDADEDSHG